MFWVRQWSIALDWWINFFNLEKINKRNKNNGVFRWKRETLIKPGAQEKWEKFFNISNLQWKRYILFNFLLPILILAIVPNYNDYNIESIIKFKKQIVFCLKLGQLIQNYVIFVIKKSILNQYANIELPNCTAAFHFINLCKTKKYCFWAESRCIQIWKMQK